MNPYTFVLVDVFTERPLAGNQLPVILDAEGLDDGQLQAIAREFNYSETTFISPDGHIAQLDSLVRILAIRAEENGALARGEFFAPSEASQTAGREYLKRLNTCQEGRTFLSFPDFWVSKAISILAGRYLDRAPEGTPHNFGAIKPTS